MKLFAVMAVMMASVVYGLNFASDVPADLKKQVLDDVAFMKTLTGSEASSLHAEIFGDFDGPTYGTWFESRVKTVGLDDCGSGNAVACVIPMRSASTMWLTPNYVKFSHPAIARNMVIYHEARHTEWTNLFWSHAQCPTPFIDPETGEDMKSKWTGASLAGEPACDETPYGSYGSSMILLKNISKYCTNCTEKVMMDAGIYADDQFKRIIESDAIEAIRDDLYS